MFTRYVLLDKTVLEVSDSCTKSYPCIHWCRINGREQTLNGLAIGRILLKNRIKVPGHFQGYLNDVKLKDW